MKKLVNIHDAVNGLKEGKTLLYPTDTIWGLGCDATNEEAIDKITEIKNRASEKSFIILVDSVSMLERYLSDFPEVCYDLIDFAERPLTIIYDQPTGLPAKLLAKDGSIGIRVTDDLNCKKMIQQLKKPLVSTSANISQHNHPHNFANIDENIKIDVDLILNDRLKEEMKEPSSMVKVGSNHNVQVIR